MITCYTCMHMIKSHHSGCHSSPNFIGCLPLPLSKNSHGVVVLSCPRRIISQAPGSSIVQASSIFAESSTHHSGVYVSSYGPLTLCYKYEPMRGESDFWGRIYLSGSHITKPLAWCITQQLVSLTGLTHSLCLHTNDSHLNTSWGFSILASWCKQLHKILYDEMGS